MKTKKLIPLIAAVVAAFLLPAALSAQDSRPSFDGVVIRGSAKTFVKKLCQKGWTATDPENHVYVLTGTWDGHGDVTLTVLEDERSKKVTDIGVIIPCSPAWDDISATWRDVVDTFSETWGPPSLTQTQFHGGGTGDDTKKLVLIQTGKCDWRARWDLRDGSAVTSVAFIAFQFCILTTISAE